MRHAAWAAAAAALSLQGADPPARRTSSEVTLLQPTGPLAQFYTSHAGLGFSGVGERDLGGGHGLRSRITLGWFSGRRVPETPDPPAGTAFLFAPGLDVAYRYQWRDLPRRPYVWAGPGAQAYLGSARARPAVEAAADNRNPVLATTWVTTSTGLQLAFTAGAGLELDARWGVNLGCHWTRAGGRTLATVDLGFTFRLPP
ncbi:hypothetical protein [Mesoterricola sediminis]|uniref:Uncharacterized protein n=1 Tax=Mesoterricola sediminis TaxID=2927980 RepID=A0AA48KF58_9BACT|nr:hypothetical protein [Mesoterricola sediminis]BDU78725.1 hypothetical protein METESE_36830 [Mesoterricola sediminis]